MQVDSTFFENFGNVSYTGLCKLNFIRDNITDDEEDVYITFKNFCQAILKNSDYNILAFHNMVFHLTNKNINKVSSVIVEVFNEYTNEIKCELEKNLTLQTFVKLYNRYLLSTATLMKHLSYFTSKVTINNNGSYEMILKQYMFYKNIINTVYTNENKYIYEILRKKVEEADMTDMDTVNIIKQLFRMYSFYNHFSNTPIKNKEQLFNSQIDKLFLTSLGSNQEFVKTIVYYLHNTIKTTNVSDKKNISNISNLINLISENFSEREMFNMYYEKLLEMRLIANEFNAELEFELINSFSRPKDNKIIQNMIHKIEDIQKSLADETILHTKIDLTVTPDSSKKYKGVDLTKLNLKTLLPRVFRNYAWSYSRTDDNDGMTVPYDVAPYIDVFNQYYKMKYPHRNLEWNFNHGTAVIKIKLGEKHYFLQLNTPQMFLLLQFNHQEKISALDLATNIGLPMSKLGKILTTFLKTKILCRESGKAANDPSMLIYLNHNFSHSSDKISLVNLVNQPKVNDSEIQDRFAIGRENLLQAAVVRQLKKHKTIAKTELLKNTQECLPFSVNDQQFHTCLMTCVNEGYMTSNNDQLSFVEE